MNEADPASLPPASPLAYGRPMGSTTPPPHPLPVMLYCLPGLICWLNFLSLFLRRFVSPGLSIFNFRFGVILILGCWGIAVITAIASLIRYVPRKPKPWYVVLNLVINITGLLFTAGILFLILVAVVH